MNTGIDPRPAPYTEGQPPMARTGIRRMLVIGLAAFMLVMGLIVVNLRHEFRAGPSQSAEMRSAPVAPRQ
jgi:hypothetical protein